MLLHVKVDRLFQKRSLKEPVSQGSRVRHSESPTTFDKEGLCSPDGHMAVSLSLSFRTGPPTSSLSFPHSNLRAREALSYTGHQEGVSLSAGEEAGRSLREMEEEGLLLAALFLRLRLLC
ncbi:5'-AMP-activated protein kinase catalytic subunit alpha-2 [Platysternon megacephalum]|uniref:5'-AMP-activated protein kinase catalytic subunit alpha-2 n=1 Tax=Platysternon megacephalum TaxID=55544 RepID=A0A4D9EHI6_9SAUR|nr:5'-AMP-activated protein kinase catalytic subunit alpha-2 [Platysternon megacephalum]